jgi:hypothetical protein
MTQDDQPFGSVRRCCERCGLMATRSMTDFFTESRATFERARNFLHVTSVRADLSDIVVVACDRTPLAFEFWNARGPRPFEGRDDGDPGDEDQAR